MSRPFKLEIVLTALLAIGLCCAGLLLTGPSWVHLVPGLPARAVSAPTATIEPSPTPTPFSLPTFTPTATRPAEIILPTIQPTPTGVTPVNSADPDLVEWEHYRTDTIKNLTDMGNALVELGPLLQNPRRGQDDWTFAVAAQLVIIQAAHDNLANTRPPERARDFHPALLNATADCSAATRQLSRGVDDLDLQFLESAVQLIESCGTKLGALPKDFLQ